MTTRYEPNGTMHQTPTGHFVTFAEHEAVIQELIESLGEYFQQVESRQLTAVDAEKLVKVFIAIRLT